MSNLVSALNGVKAKGFASVEELGLSGMITVRGDLSSKEMAKAVKEAVDLPGGGARDYWYVAMREGSFLGFAFCLFPICGSVGSGDSPPDGLLHQQSFFHRGSH